MDNSKWESLKNKISLYFSETHRDRSENFPDILVNSDLQLHDLVGSFSLYSKLDENDAIKMATQRELKNIQMKSTPESTNQSVLGCKKSLARRDSNVIQPGNQLSLAVNTMIRVANGQLRKITLLSCTAPALDSSSQPEADLYSYKNFWGDRTLNRINYVFALDTLKSHILQCAEKETNCKRAVLAGIGAASFLDMLNDEQKACAKDMIAHMLADAAVELRKMGKTVVFTDVDDKFLQRINEKLSHRKQELVTRVGTVPGEWIQDGDLMINAWDPHSLLGNGQASDNSLDGYFGRHSLIHFQHALVCMMHSLGMKVKWNYVNAGAAVSGKTA